MDLLTQHAAAHGAKAAVIVDAAGGGRPSATSYAELEVMANRLAHALLALGAIRGDRIAWCGPNSLEVITTLHASRKAGLTSVPVSYRFNAARDAVRDRQLRRHRRGRRRRAGTARRVGPRPTSRRCGTSSSSAATRPRVVRDGTRSSPRQSDAPPADADPEAGAAGATMIYTSGTTGKPKGAMRTGTDAGAIGALLDRLDLLQPDPVHITTGPLYHSGPLSFALFAHALGGTIVVLRKFDPSAWLRLVKEHRVTDTFSAPTQLKRIVALPPGELARADLSSMRTLIANAAPVPYALKQELIEKLGDGFLYEVYGSTELGVVTVLRARATSCASRVRAASTYGPIEVRIVARRRHRGAGGGAGRAVHPHHARDGRLPPHRRAASRSTAADWKSVGDVAYLDDEGYLFICDRKKDMIISGGVNIYPAEIEAVIHEHPAILDVAVFGIPDDEWGERVHAIVQPRADATLDLDELRRVRGGARRRLQAPARLRGARRAAAHRVGQAAQARAARRVLADRETAV